MSKSMDTVMWNSLGKKGPLLFGEECGSAALWMFMALFLRCIITLVRIEPYVPTGLLFAFPLILQFVGKYVPFMKTNYPVLPVRIAEGIMGRIAPANMLVVIPAHFLGSVVGIVLFKTLFPFVPSVVFHPVYKVHLDVNSGTITEAFATFLCTVMILVLPEMLSVNKLNPKILSAAMFPVMFLHYHGQWCNFNPSVAYALWYVNRASYEIPTVVQWLNIVAPCLGAVAAGLFCNTFFPDKASSWTRRSERFK